MPNPTKIVVHFDDGSTTDIDAAGVGSIYFNEPSAIASGHNPPYRTSQNGSSGSEVNSLMSTTDDASADESDGSCYYVNGMIVCP